MPQIATITINDGKTPTAEAHAFAPVSTTPPVFNRNNVAGQPVIGQERILIKSIRAAKTDGVNRVQVELVVPVLEQAAGGSSSGYVAAPQVAHELRFKGEFLMHQRSDSAGRKDLRVLASNLLLNAMLVGAVDSLEQPY